MFSITFKGKQDPTDPKMVKLEMVFYQSGGFNRVSRVVNITGPYKQWDAKTQGFKCTDKDAIQRNQSLLEIKNRYMSVAQQWEHDEHCFTTLQWADCFKEEEKEKLEQKKDRTLSLQEMIEKRHQTFLDNEKFKNGKIIKSINTAATYVTLQRSLSEFTETQYNRPLSRVFFTDVTRTFLLDFSLFIEKKGIESGNKGGLRQKLRLIRAICRYAKETQGISGVDMTIFDAVHEKMRWGKFESKAVNPYYYRRMEYIDRSLFSEREQLHIDMVMFSYYSGGMANVDTINFTTDMINDDQIVYERTKFPKLARPILLDKAKIIVDRYKGQGIDDYVFPVYTKKHVTGHQRVKCRKRFTKDVNETLRKVCRVLGIEDKITWYSGRGTFISKMLDEGKAILLVAGMAGNSGMIIERHYYKNVNREQVVKGMNRSF